LFIVEIFTLLSSHILIEYGDTMIPFEQIDVSGDVGLRIQGLSLEELFMNAALGLFSLITDIKQVRTVESLQLHVEAEREDDLLIRWLNELIFLFDAEEMLIRESVPVIERDGTQLSLDAELRGERFDPERHSSRLLIKAATYHNVSLKRHHTIWEGIVIFDI